MNVSLKHVYVRIEREMLKHLILWNGGSRIYCRTILQYLLRRLKHVYVRIEREMLKHLILWNGLWNGESRIYCRTILQYLLRRACTCKLTSFKKGQNGEHGCLLKGLYFSNYQRFCEKITNFFTLK